MQVRKRVTHQLTLPLEGGTRHHWYAVLSPSINPAPLHFSLEATRREPPVSKVLDLRGCSTAFRWAFSPDPTRDCPSLDPDSLARGQLRFVRYAAKPTKAACFSDQHALILLCQIKRDAAWGVLDFTAPRRGPVVRAAEGGEFGVPRMPGNQADPSTAKTS